MNTDHHRTPWPQLFGKAPVRQKQADPMQFAFSARPGALRRSLSAQDFLVLCSCVVVLLLLLVVYLAQSADIVKEAYAAQEVKATLDRVQQENELLRMEIAQLQNLARVQKRAVELGFGTPERVDFLRLSGSEGEGGYDKATAPAGPAG